LQAAVAAQPDWQLAEEHIYRDDGYSGARLNRPGLDRLRDHAACAASLLLDSGGLGSNVAREVHHLFKTIEKEGM
jgi:hypothetical protein